MDKFTKSQHAAMKWLAAADGEDAHVTRVWDDGTIEMHTWEDLAYFITRRGAITSK